MRSTVIEEAKFTNIANAARINFMLNCVVEMYAVDQVSAYQHAFVYIRQLAIHLKHALSDRSKDAYQNVYNWQFINSLKVWCKLLSAYWHMESLRHLLYPLVQLIFGVIELVPTPRYYPLRFHCCELLNELAQKTNTFINVAPYLLEVLDGPLFGKPGKRSTIKPINFKYALRVGPKALDTAIYGNEVFDHTTRLLLQCFAIHSHSLAFPEFVLPSVVFLKKFVRKSRNVTQNKQIANLLEKVEENTSHTNKMRYGITFGPNDLSQLHSFHGTLPDTPTPLMQYHLLRLKSGTHSPRPTKQRKVRDEEVELEGEEENDGDGVADLVLSDSD